MLSAGVAVFILTGALLAVQRLASAPLPISYPIVLVIKVGLGVWMFVLARRAGTNASIGALRVPIPWQLAGIGVVIYGLAIALRAIYEDAIRA